MTDAPAGSVRPRDRREVYHWWYDACARRRADAEVVWPLLTWRQRTLFLAACARDVWPMLADWRSRLAVVRAEQYADGRAAECSRAMFEVAFAIWSPGDAAGTAPWRVGLAARCAALVALAARGEWLSRHDDSSPANLAVLAACPTAWPARLRGEPDAATELARLRQCDRLVGVAGVGLAFDLTWRTGNAVALARGIYDRRAWHLMPVLADALEDAGCADADVLAHCREGGPVCRGWWVLDQLTGREPLRRTP